MYQFNRASFVSSSFVIGLLIGEHSIQFDSINKQQNTAKSSSYSLRSPFLCLACTTRSVSTAWDIVTAINRWVMAVVRSTQQSTLSNLPHPAIRSNKARFRWSSINENLCFHLLAAIAERLIIFSKWISEIAAHQLINHRPGQLVGRPANCRRCGRCKLWNVCLSNFHRKIECLELFGWISSHCFEWWLHYLILFGTKMICNKFWLCSAQPRPHTVIS